jgi:hypothetical protein
MTHVMLYDDVRAQSSAPPLFAMLTITPPKLNKLVWVTLGDLERLLRECQGRLLSRQKYWKDADPRTLSLEEVKRKKEEDEEEAEHGDQMERQMDMLQDSFLQFGGL